jgi:hypothetical protein
MRKEASLSKPSKGDRLSCELPGPALPQRLTRSCTMVFGFSGPGLHQDTTSLLHWQKLEAASSGRCEITWKLSHPCPESGCIKPGPSADWHQYWHFGRGTSFEQGSHRDVSTRCQNICTYMRTFHYCGRTKYRVFNMKYSQVCGEHEVIQTKTTYGRFTVTNERLYRFKMAEHLLSKLRNLVGLLGIKQCACANQARNIIHKIRLWAHRWCGKWRTHDNKAN